MSDIRYDRGRDLYVFTHEDETGLESEILIPAVVEVCTGCGGKGRHVNRSIDGNGLTADDFAEDPDFAVDYFSGAYDVTCVECNGSNVERWPDTSKLSDADAKLYEDWLCDEASWAAEAAYERRMGC